MTKSIKSVAAALAFITLASHASAETHQNANKTHLIKQNHKVEIIKKLSTPRKMITQKTYNTKSNVIVRHVDFDAPVNTRTIVINSSQASQTTPNLFK